MSLALLEVGGLDIHSFVFFYLFLSSEAFYLYVFSSEGNGTPLQYSCPENPMDGGAWKSAVHGVEKSRTQLSDFQFHCFL